MKDKSGEDVKQRSILRTVKGTSGYHYMEYNIMSGWSCSCTSFKYRRTCKHVLDANAEQNEYGACIKCKNCRLIRDSNPARCILWGIILEHSERFNCGVWERKN